MKSFKQSLTILSLVSICVIANAQTTEGVSIKSNVSPPHPSAMLDIESASKGVLIPRVILQSSTDVSTIFNPKHSLLVFNTNTSTLNNLRGQGFYYWNQINATTGEWIKLGESSKMLKVTFSDMQALITNSGLTTNDIGLMVYCTTTNQSMGANTYVSTSVFCRNYDGGTVTNYNVRGVWYLGLETICTGQDVLAWKYIENNSNGLFLSATNLSLNCNSGPCTGLPD